MIPRLAARYLAVSAMALLGLFVAREDIKLTAYIPVKGDVPTIGGGTTRYENGKPVRLGDKITPARALMLLGKDVDVHTSGLMKCIGDIPLYQRELDAYAALAHNVGPGAVCHSSIPTKLRAGQFSEACATIKDFNGVCTRRAGGKCVEKRVLRGLVNAREREYKWCMGESHASQ